MNSVEKLIKRLHLLALLPVLGIFFIFLIFFIPDKKLILFLFLILPFPSILYGKHWARDFSCFLKNKKLIKKKIWQAPSFVTFYIILFSYLILSFLTKHSLTMKLIIAVEIWCIFYIFYAIGFCSPRTINSEVRPPNILENKELE